MKTIEEITARMTEISNLVDDDMTEDVLTEFDGLEAELKQAQKVANVRDKTQQYNTVVIPAGVPRQQSTDPDGPSELDLAFRNYLRTGVPNADISQLQNAQGTGTGAGGGYTVPTLMRQKLTEVMQAYGGFAPLAETLNTSNGNPMEWPRIDDTANTGGIAAEGGNPANGADLTFSKDQLGAYRYTSAGAGSGLPVRISKRLMEDSAVDVEGLVARYLGIRIARAQAAHWCTGTGVGEPWGIVSDSITADNDLDTADTPDYEDLVDTLDALDEAYEPGSTWVMRKNTWSQLRLIVDGNGRPILQDMLSGIGGAPQKMLLNYPVVTVPEMPLLSSAGITKPIALGNWRLAYVIRYVGSPTVLVNPYSRMEQGELEFTGEQWADGTIQDRSAYVVTRNNT